jgi:Spy/CpxP family protein refolding chaperone
MSPLSPRRSRLAGAALLVATFAAGMLAGTAFGRVLSAGEPDARAQADRERGRGSSMIIDALDLAPEQRAQVDRIMAERRALTDSLWREDGARIRAVVDSTRAEIRALLTPEQRAEYDRLKAEHEQRHRERQNSRGEGRERD